jgi:hypothetical protein
LLWLYAEAGLAVRSTDDRNYSIHYALKTRYTDENAMIHQEVQ